jgi:long-subunit fatty acid transport protein
MICKAFELRTLLALLVFTLLLTLTTQAQSLVSIYDLGMGARPMAMGGAFSAVADDESALLYNPAGLATLDGFHFRALF